MALYISGSNRKGNCYRILNDLRNEGDTLIALADKSINYCLGCNACMDYLDSYCIMEDDDMQEIYDEILKNDEIIIATPIYMNHITGILKNMIDRLNPFCWHDEMLLGKTVYLITVGQMDEEENADIAENIKEYFEGIGEFLGFKVKFLRNFTSGDIRTSDNITKMYKNYEAIIRKLKREIEN